MITGRNYKSRNPDYLVHIYNETAGVDVKADLAETFSIGAASSFGAWDLQVGDLLPGANLAQNIGGGSLVLGAFTKLMWKSTAPITFPLEITFDARQASKEDVHDIACALVALTLPYGFGGKPYSYGEGFGGDAVLLPPNPTFITGKKNVTEIRIGKQFFFPSMAVDNVQYSLENRLASDGYPIAGTVAMNVTTDWVYSRGDWARAASLSYG